MAFQSVGSAAAGWFAGFLGIELRCTLVVLLALLVGLFARRWQARARHSIWLLACVSLLAVPLLGAVVPSVDIPLRGRTAATASVAKASAWLIHALEVTPRASGFSVQPGHGPALPWQACIIFVWLAGSAVLLARLAWAHARVLGARRRATEDDDGEWCAACANAARQLGLKRAPRLLVSDAFGGPVTVGLLRPAILRPAAEPKMVACSSAVRAAVAAHEVAHVARWDGWGQLLADVVCAFHWPNPLVWWLARAVRLEAERACDDAVLAHGVAPSWYADQLLHLAQGNGRQPDSLVALGGWGRSFLERRIRYLLVTHPRKAPSRVGLSVMGALALPTMAFAAGLGVLGVVPSAPPQRATVTIAADALYLLPMGGAKKGASLPGEKVVQLSHWDVQGEAKRDRLIVPLANRLRGASPGSVEADIRAAAPVPYELLLRVLYTVGESGYDRLGLVIQGPAGERTIPLHGGLGANRESKLALIVAISRKGFGILATPSDAAAAAAYSLAIEPTIPKTEKDGFDFRHLTATLTEVKKAFPAETQVVVAAELDTTYELLSQTLDAVRESKEHRSLFPDVILGTL